MVGFSRPQRSREPGRSRKFCTEVAKSGYQAFTEGPHLLRDLNALHPAQDLLEGRRKYLPGKGPTHFVEMLRKLSSVYMAQQLLVDHQRELKYPATLGAGACRPKPAFR
jgi:hypothetical protein